MSDEDTPQSRAAFERLYMTHASAVRRHLVYLTGDSSLAEDLAQETFSRLYLRQAEQAGEPENPRAWLLTVASNLAYNHFRGESRRSARENALADVIDVRRALGELEVRDRMTLMLRHSGFSYAEVAEAIGVSPASVGTILARAQARFRTAYEGNRRTGAEKE